MSGSFRRDKKDEDSGFGWKVLGAAALTGAVAAAAYGAKKLYDYMEEKDSEQNQAGKWDDEHYQNIPERPMQDTSARQLDSGSGKSSLKQSSLQQILSATDVSLHEKLQEYHNGYVNIPIMEMDRAKDVLFQIKKPILKYLQEMHPNVVTELIDCGSTKEGLKVVKPDEFDVMIPLNIIPGAFTVEEAGSAPGYISLKKEHTEMVSSLDKFLSNHTNAEGYEYDEKENYLSPQKLREHFQSCIQKAINSITAYKVSSGPKGPSITIHVEYDGNKKFTVDFVAVVILGETQVVAKPHPEYLKNKRSTHEKYWRQSFSHREWDVIARQSSDSPKKCLKIAKAVRLNVPQLGMFNSYVFKTIFLHMLEDTSEDEWDENALPERFIDFFNTLLLHLRKGHLPHHFNPCINLLEFYSDIAIENSKNFLTAVITKNKYSTLLKTDF